MRFFDLRTSSWKIIWIDGRNPALDTPLVGAFTDGIGTFFAKESIEGRPILVRFRWSDIGEHSARWEQAFSDDDGASWEINWIMLFGRR